MLIDQVALTSPTFLAVLNPVFMIVPNMFMFLVVASWMFCVGNITTVLLFVGLILNSVKSWTIMLLVAVSLIMTVFVIFSGLFGTHLLLLSKCSLVGHWHIPFLSVEPS